MAELPIWVQSSQATDETSLGSCEGLIIEIITLLNKELKRSCTVISGTHFWQNICRNMTQRA